VNSEQQCTAAASANIRDLAKTLHSQAAGPPYASVAPEPRLLHRVTAAGSSLHMSCSDYPKGAVLLRTQRREFRCDRGGEKRGGSLPCRARITWISEIELEKLGQKRRTAPAVKNRVMIGQNELAVLFVSRARKNRSSGAVSCRIAAGVPPR